MTQSCLQYTMSVSKISNNLNSSQLMNAVTLNINFYVRSGFAFHHLWKEISSYLSAKASAVQWLSIPCCLAALA